jgi:hypothetical protein
MKVPRDREPSLRSAISIVFNPKIQLQEIRFENFISRDGLREHSGWLFSIKQMPVLPWRMVTGRLIPIAGDNVLIFSTGD